MPKMFSPSTMFFKFFFAHENMKKPASKVAKPAQIQPKSQILFLKNLPPRDFSIMTLVIPNSFFVTNQPDFQAWLQYKVWINLGDSFSYFFISITSKSHNPTSINELAATAAWMTLHIPLFLKIWHPRCFFTC